MKLCIAQKITLITIALLFSLSVLSAPNPDTATEDFINNPKLFLEKYHINMLPLFEKKDLPGGGYIKLMPDGSGGVEVKYMPAYEPNTTPAFFFNRRNPNNPSPMYMDILKENNEGTLVITQPLNGESLIVTDHNQHTYRVYRDSRPGSIAVAYENVVFATGIENYGSEQLNSNIAGAFLIYKNKEWRLMVQPLKFELPTSQPLKPILLKRSNSFVIEQSLGDVNDNKLLTSFNYQRKNKQSTLINLAEEIGVTINESPVDRRYEEDDMRVDENSALREWEQLKQLIKRKLNKELEPLYQEQKELHAKLNLAKKQKIKNEIKKAIEANEQIIEYSDSKYLNAIEQLNMYDSSWLWLQRKKTDGFDRIVNPYDDPAKKRYTRFVDKFLIEAERFENMSGHDGQQFRYGMENSKNIPIPGKGQKMTVVELIKLFFSNEYLLSSAQKGALFYHIETEHLSSLNHASFKRADIIGNYMRAVGAVKVDLIPQDIMLVGKLGLCTSLSETMAVALAQNGDDGVRQLSDRLIETMDDSKSKTSQNIYNTLKDLRYSPLTTSAKTVVKTKKGSPVQSNIDDLILKLETQNIYTGSVMMLVMGDIHAMLVGKTHYSGVTSYYFYDPNFGIFKFKTSELLKKGLNKHLVTEGYAKKYSAYGKNPDKVPLFELTMIDTSKLAPIQLSTGLSVEDIIYPQDSLRKKTIRADVYEFVSTAQHLRGNKIKVGLDTLKNINLIDQVTESINKIYKINDLDSNWILILDSLEKSKSKNDYSLRVMKHENNKVKIISFKDDTLWKFKTHLNKQFKRLKKIYNFKENKKNLNYNVGDVEHVNGLNAAMTIETIINIFRDKNKKKGNTYAISNLAKAIEVHTYINLTQMSYGTAEQLVEILKLYRMALNGGIIKTTSVLSKVSHLVRYGANPSLGVVSIFLDGYELDHAENEQQKAVFATQLAFDSTSLGTGIAEIGAGLIGATTASAILGMSNDILGGLTIGFTALAQAFGEVADDAKAVGSYFASVDYAYKSKGYHLIKENTPGGSSFYAPIDGAVITQLDFVNNQLSFDSQYLYRTEHGKTGSGAINYFFWAGDFPEMLNNKSQAINVREMLNYPVTADISLNSKEVDAIVLPITPKSYISYIYQILPGATTLQHKGFDVLRKLEKAKTFDYDFYIFPSEYIVRKITQEYVTTNIKVDLNRDKQDLFMRKLTPALKDKLHYTLTGNGGEYRVHLQPGAKFTLKNDTEASTWIFDVRSIENKNHTLTKHPKKILKLGDTIDIDISQITQGKIIIINNHNELLSVDLEGLYFVIISEDASKWPSLKQLSQYLDSRIDNQHLNSNFIRIENFIPPGKSEKVGTAYYQVDKKRFVYTPLPAKKDLLNNAQLITIIGDLAYFQAAHELWLVDIEKNKIIRQYRLFNWNYAQEDPIKTRAWQEGQHLYFAVTQQMNSGFNARWTYRVKKNKLQLISVNGDTQLISILSSDTTKNTTDVRAVFKTTDDFLNGKIDLQPEKWVDASFADIISVSAKINNKKKRFWVFTKQMGNTGVVKANIKKPINDLILVHTNNEKNNTQFHYFYSHNKKRIYIQKGANSYANIIKISDNNTKINKVFLNGNKLFVTTIDNKVWLIDQKAWLFGVTSRWMINNYTQVLNKISELAQKEPRKAAQLSLLGVTNDKKEKINFWFENRTMQLVVAGSNLNDKPVSLLGVTSDKKSAWLFNRDDNSLYKQSILSGDISINEQLKLFSGIDQAQKVSLLSGHITKANLYGQQIQLTTKEGLVLVIDKDTTPKNIKKPLLIAIRPKWQKSHDDLLPAINKLKENYILSDQVELIGHNYPSWYLTKGKRIFNAKTFSVDGQVKYIGEAVNGGDYVYNAEKNILYLYKNNNIKYMGFFENLYIYKKSLIIKSGRKITIPKIKEIRELFWSDTEGNYNFQLTKSVIGHYKYITIENYKGKNRLTMPAKNYDNIMLQNDNDNFVIYNRDFRSKIIITNSKLNSNKKFKLIVGNHTSYLFNVLRTIDSRRKINGQIFYFSDIK
ncbi:TcdA/TcdB pore-forming domain-containing protein [Photobacterium leiognathi]|uniref:TcdA/TcdB pore-forming domain-containing protein n=1 Tax=Photobacterium leiognathi TaxID=553611 RepID=UPI002982792B|nr:TcdA/TcdB pore-forming domain-containing protein [Photobacterium leiognathi]